MINSAHLHLLLNHFPVIGTIIIILVVGYGLIRKNKEIIKTGLIVTVIIAVISIFSYTTGEGAEDLVEGLDGVNEEYIDEHEDAALYGLILIETLGAFALLGLVFLNKKEKYPLWFISLYLLLLLTTIAAMANIANLGGKIHHPEIIETSVNQNNYQDDNHGEDHDGDDD
jgi:uncharacterized membrane protein